MNGHAAQDGPSSPAQDRVKRLLWSLAIGAAAGLSVALPWELVLPLIQAHRILSGAAVGIIVAVWISLLWEYRKRIPFIASLSSIELSLPGGAKATISLTAAERQLLWRFFLELTTRIATQPLESGSLREALSSIYGIFATARADLATLAPRLVTTSTMSPRIYVLQILNREFRPLLARWHPRLSEWEKTGMAESTWPLDALCRHDLEVTRLHVVALAWNLGDALGYSGLDHLLPAKVETDRQLADGAKLREVEKNFVPRISADRIAAGWHIYVETVTRIATQPLEAGIPREALQSLYTLFGIVRDELKTLGLLPYQVAGDAVEAIGLRLLNECLRPVLAKWHPALSEWEAQKSSDAWPQEAACRADIESMRKAVVIEIETLCRLLGIPPE